MGFIQDIRKLFSNRENACTNLTAEYTHKADSLAKNENQQNHPTETDEINAECTLDNSPRLETSSTDPDNGLEFLTTPGIIQGIKDIIKNADEYIKIISPYLNIYKDFKEFISCLTEAEKKKTKIKIDLIFGKEEMKPNEKREFYTIKTLKIHYSHNLHAKCYMNEKQALITSMNLSETSKNNHEIGIMFFKKQHEKIYENIESNMSTIIQDSEQYTLKPDAYCIICGNETFFDADHPACKNCYNELKTYYKSISYAKTFAQNFCHKCRGDGYPETKWNITFLQPICSRCTEQSAKT